MSRKRDKNARKKAVKKKRQQKPSPSDVPIDRPTNDYEAPDWEADHVEPEIAVGAAASSGGGAMGRIRTAVSPNKGTSGDTLLTRRRSVPELMVWLAGGIAIVWLLWQIWQGIQAEKAL